MKNGLLKLLTVALTGAVLFAGCGKIDSNATLVTITNDGAVEKITLGYGNFVARYTQALYDSYYGSVLSDGFWDNDMYGNGNTMEQDTKDAVLDEMKTYYLCKLHADEYGVSLNEEQTEMIEDAVAQFMSDNDDEGLKEVGATEEYVRDYLTYRTYYALVKEQIDAEETEETEDAEETEESSDEEETTSLFEEKTSEWESAITWTVDEKQWEKVKFENKFVAPETSSETEETAEE